MDWTSLPDLAGIALTRLMRTQLLLKGQVADEPGDFGEQMQCSTRSGIWFRLGEYKLMKRRRNQWNNWM
jgi:hypothetical protein